MKILKLSLCLAVLVAESAVYAETESLAVSAQRRDSSPVAFGLLPNCEWPDAAYDVAGVRFNLFAGEHHDAYFLTLSGLADLVAGECAGVQLAGLYARAGSSLGALQVAGFANVVDRDFDGVQVSAFGNLVRGKATGLSVAMYTRAETFEGLQVGLFNRARNLNGVQIGLVNWAEESEGIQIGLVNVMKEGRYPVMLVFNADF